MTILPADKKILVSYHRPFYDLPFEAELIKICRRSQEGRVGAAGAGFR